MIDGDQQLLIQTIRGHRPAAERLWSRFAPAMLAYARTLVRDDAPDIVQSVFLNLLQLRPREVRRINDVHAWLLRLTRNAALNHLRSIRRERQRRANFSPLREPHPRPSTDELELALHSLPRRDRELLVLKHIVGLTFDQIAVTLTINRNTAAARHRAAVQRLRTALSDEPELAPAGELS
jgi:RNA polymerase sigma-70 factor, ECF subfamily